MKEISGASSGSKAAQDVALFLSVSEQANFPLWNDRFFTDKISKQVQALV
jgi:hypothetical protein